MLDGETAGPIEGYGWDEAVPISGDHLFAPARWAEREDISGLVGRPVRIEVAMHGGGAVRHTAGPRRLLRHSAAGYAGVTGEGSVDVEGLAAEVMSRLEAAANPERAEKGASYTPTSARIIGVAVPDVRRAAREAVRELKGAPPAAALELARALIGTDTLEGRHAAYEVLGWHKGVRATLDAPAVESLGEGMDNWASVDAYCWLVAGPAWLEGRLGDGVIEEWGALGGQVVAPGRTRLNDGPEQEVAGRQRGYSAHAEDMPDAGDGPRRHGRQGPVVGAAGTRALGQGGGRGIPGGA